MPQVSFGIATAPQHVGYADILRVWREADGELEHAWLFDHLMPIASNPRGPIFDGWTLLSALAAQTRRLRLGLLVTSNRFRPPASARASPKHAASTTPTACPTSAFASPSTPWRRPAP